MAVNPNEAPTSESPPETLIFNGINGATGAYLLPEMTPAQVSRLAQGQVIEDIEARELKQRVNDIQAHAGVEADAHDLSKTGWGVIFPFNTDPAVVEALAPLLKLRQEQAGERYKLYTGPQGYRPGESKGDFLDRHGMGPGSANPDKVPYYLLVVGDPATIPYRFQYQLDVQYAVGRLDLDTAEDYAHYAESVVQSEKGLRLPPQATFFGVANPDDRATQMSAEGLVQPLAEKLAGLQPEWAAEAQKSGSQLPNWALEILTKEKATKANLSSLLESRQAPALLFSASHGMAFPNGDARQLPHQGALLCQDWPGPTVWREAIPPDFYFAGDDLSSDANLLGTLAFFFACYGAGTPQVDEFAPQLRKDQPEAQQIAPHDFVAALPRRMLSLPKGGALAVVGHVERAWGVSFFWGKSGPQLQVFQDCLQRLMKDNYPIGYAAEVFNNRYAEISSDLTAQLDEIRYKFLKPNDMELARLWTANNDARNYVVLGDPAVRLPTGDGKAGEAERPSIPEISSVRRVQTDAVSGILPPPGGQEPDGTGPVSPPAGVNYGVMEDSLPAQVDLSGTLQAFIMHLNEFLSKTMDESKRLEVSTYVSNDLSAVKFEGGRFSGAQLRALTRIEVNGDILNVVPEAGGEVDPTVWKAHMDMVQQAQADRTELLKTLVSAATGLADLIKP